MRSRGRDHKTPFGNMDAPNAKTLGEVVRSARKRHGLTQRDVAMACGTGLRFIIELEAGKESCHLGKALGVVRALGLRVRVEEP